MATSAILRVIPVRILYRFTARSDSDTSRTLQEHEVLVLYKELSCSLLTVMACLLSASAKAAEVDDRHEHLGTFVASSTTWISILSALAQ